MNRLNLIYTNKRQFLLFTLIFLLFHLAYIINWDLSLTQVGDNLDGMLPTIKSLTKSKHFFSFDNSIFIEGYNEQVLRNSLFAPWNINSIIFYFISSSWLAYFINMLMINLISLSGLFLLITFLIKESKYNYLIFIISLTFMALPKYLLFGGAVYSGLPLILYVFLSTIEKCTVYKLILLFFLPCTVGIVIGGFGIIIYTGVLLILLSKSNKQKLSTIIISYLVYLFGSVFADLNLFIFKFSNSNFKAHRELRNLDTNYRSLDFFSALKDFFKYSVKDGFNEQTSSPKYILITLFIFLIIYVFGRKSSIKEKPYLNKILVLNMIFIPICVGTYLLIKHKLLPLPSILYQFDITRLTSLLPSLYYITFGILLFKIVKRNTNFGKLIALILIVLNFVTVIRGNDNWKENIKVVLKGNYDSYLSSSLTPFKNFYSENLFENLHSRLPDIKNSQLKTMSYGMHPAIGAYSGYNTVDFYQNIYGINYNYHFRNYFDLDNTSNLYYWNKLTSWGNRVYFLDDFLLDNWKYKDQVIQISRKTDEPLFKWDQIKNDNIQILFTPIKFKITKNLELIDSFKGNDLVYKTIHVYKIL